MRSLESLIRQAGLPALFGVNSFPMADRLFAITPPGDANGLGAALTPLHLAFVESIDNYGRTRGDAKYFWGTIKQRFPALHEALHRIRVYRHEHQHLALSPGADASLRYFLEKDLPGDLIHSDDRHWLLFQACLDELLQALQREISLLRG